MLILCCGNKDRGDDGAGILAAEHLTRLGVPAETYTGEATALIQRWSKAQDVLVVDAVMTGGPAGTIHCWDARRIDLPLRRSDSTHGFGVGEAIELSRALGKLPERMRIYGIEGGQWQLGASVCATVQHATEVLAEKIASEYWARQTSQCMPSGVERAHRSAST